MENLKMLLLLAILATLISCDKDSPQPTPAVSEQPVFLNDQAIIETRMLGKWKGTILAADYGVDTLTVTIREMKLAEQVGRGKYQTEILSCGFEWTYESFDKGVVTFRESSIAPNYCFRDAAIKAYLQEDDLSVMHLSIELPGPDYIGTLVKQ